MHYMLQWPRMQEYVTAAVSLRKYPQGDSDGRYVLFTERFGKMAGRTKSSRKITSKLAPHLEPGTLLKVRFVEVHGTQIIDALKERNAGLPFTALDRLAMMLPDGQPEPELWRMVIEGRFSWHAALAVLGWDPEDAVCGACGIRPGAYFYISRQDFFCASCVRKLPSIMRQNAVISLHVPLQSERNMDEQGKSEFAPNGPIQDRSEDAGI